MGDIADWIIEQMLDRGEYWGNYARRDDRHDLRYKKRTCRSCGTHPLFFRQLPDGKWRLHDASNNLHTCPRKDISNVSDFLSLIE